MVVATFGDNFQYSLVYGLPLVESAIQKLQDEPAGKGRLAERQPSPVAASFPHPIWVGVARSASLYETNLYDDKAVDGHQQHFLSLENSLG